MSTQQQPDGTCEQGLARILAAAETKSVNPPEMFPREAGKPQTDRTRKLLRDAARLILRAEMELGQPAGPVPLGSRIEFSRDQGLATVFLWARLPLPAEPVPAPAVPGDTLPPPALQRIESLLPEVLSELRFGRTPRPE